MQVRVLYFGILKEIVGIDREDIELAPGSSAIALIEQIRGRALSDKALWRSIAIAVNQVYTPATTLLQDGDEVALLPPVSGGAREDRADAR